MAKPDYLCRSLAVGEISFNLSTILEYTLEVCQWDRRRGELAVIQIMYQEATPTARGLCVLAIVWYPFRQVNGTTDIGYTIAV